VGIRVTTIMHIQFFKYEKSAGGHYGLHFIFTFKHVYTYLLHLLTKNEYITVQLTSTVQRQYLMPSRHL